MIVIQVIDTTSQEEKDLFTYTATVIPMYEDRIKTEGPEHEEWAVVAITHVIRYSTLDLVKVYVEKVEPE